MKVADFAKRADNRSKSDVCEQLLGQARQILDAAKDGDDSAAVACDLSEVADTSRRGQRLEGYMEILRENVAERDPPRPTVFEALWKLADKWRRKEIAEEVSRLQERSRDMCV